MDKQAMFRTTLYLHLQEEMRLYLQCIRKKLNIKANELAEFQSYMLKYKCPISASFSMTD
jgi:hypothetical protein